MTRFLIKIFFSSFIIAGVSEMAKRNTWIGAFFISLPLTSILAMIWLYQDTHDPQKIIDLSYGIFWIVIPSLAFFLILPFCMKRGIQFPWALVLSSSLTAVIYLLYSLALKKLGVKI